MALRDLFNTIKTAFVGKRVEDVTLEELERQGNHLRAEEEKIHARQDELSAREGQLLAEGREARVESMKKRIAVKIKDGRDELRSLDQRLAVLSKSARVVRGLRTIKENETFYRSAGLGNALAGIPLERIIAYIEKAPEGVERDVDGMSEILEALGAADSAMSKAVGTAESDAELDDIMREMSAAPDPTPAREQSTARPTPIRRAEEARGQEEQR